MKINYKHTNCELIKEKIDLLIFEENKQLSSEISGHIRSCELCQAYFTDSISARKIIGQMQKDPELHNPDGLSSTILNLVEKEYQTPKSNSRNHKIYWLVRRTLAAASISLMIVFGIEQYILFDKISKMEEYISYVSIEFKNTNFNIELKNGNLYKLLHYNLGFQPESINDLISGDFEKSEHSKLKARLIRTRLSALAQNKIDNPGINQLIQTVATRSKTN